MDKLRIGIVAPRHYEIGDPFSDTYKVVNNYLKRIDKSDVIPYGVVFPDGKFNEDFLDIYDGFIFEGGVNVCKYHFGVIEYAIRKNKPILGICAGMQAIGIYSNVLEELENDNMEITYFNLVNYYNRLKVKNNYYLKKLNGHNLAPDFKDSDLEYASHKVYLNKDSKIYDIYKKDSITEPSIHYHSLSKVGKDFVITGIYKDSIEVIEHKDKFIIGVQFHPEIEEKNQVLFDRFLEEVKKNKLN